MNTEDRVYHGIWESGRGRLQVERPEPGPTERELHLEVLRVLHPPEHHSFGWGHNGGGTSFAAAAILADALDEPLDRYGWGHNTGDVTDNRLREHFCEDVLAQLCEEWRLRRGAVLRWVWGWYAEHGLDELPRAFRRLQPIGEYQT